MSEAHAPAGLAHLTPAARRGAHTVPDALEGALTAIAAAGCETPRLDAEVLLAHVLGVPRERLLIDRELVLAGDAVRAYQSAVRRRAVEREPVAYITGRRAFAHIELRVDSRALIPRPETELLVEVGVELGRGARVLDLCTGCGAIALALAHERPDLRISASDRSEAALALARENAAALGIAVEWRRADLLAGVPDVHEAILCNPPYVAESARHELAPEIVRHEPSEALFAGADGLETIRALIAAVAPRERVALLALEHGAGQAAAVRGLAYEAGFADARSIRDLAGIERVMVAERR